MAWRIGFRLGTTAGGVPASGGGRRCPRALSALDGWPVRGHAFPGRLEGTRRLPAIPRRAAHPSPPGSRPGPSVTLPMTPPAAAPRRGRWRPRQRPSPMPWPERRGSSTLYPHRARRRSYGSSNPSESRPGRPAPTASLVPAAPIRGPRRSRPAVARVARSIVIRPRCCYQEGARSLFFCCECTGPRRPATYSCHVGHCSGARVRPSGKKVPAEISRGLGRSLADRFRSFQALAIEEPH